MEPPNVGYSADQSQNMVLVGGLTKCVPITDILFYKVHFLFVETNDGNMWHEKLLG